MKTTQAKRLRRDDPDRPIPTPDQAGGGRTFGGRDQPHYSTWLQLRYQSGDDGSRPLAAGSVFWESPDVWTQGSQGKNNPVPNEPTQVFANVGNDGLQDAVGVILKYWWADPSVTITENSAHLFATDTVSIPSQNWRQFKSPVDWIPVTKNNGHECLIVEAYIPFFDDLTDTMHPMGDRHVGQKNEQLVVAKPGHMFSVPLEAHNFTHTEQKLMFETRRALIPRNFGARFAGRTQWQGALLDPARPVSVHIKIGGEPVRVDHSSRLLSDKHNSESHSCLPPPDTAKSHVFERGEVRKLTITGALPASAIPGEVYVTRVTQRIGNTVTGGYTIYVMAA